MPQAPSSRRSGVTVPLRHALQAMLLAATSTGTAAAPEPCKLQQLKMPVQLVERRPVAQLTLNGTEAQMLVDSGAFFSVLSKATATQLKLPLRWLKHPKGRMQPF